MRGNTNPRGGLCFSDTGSDESLKTVPNGYDFTAEKWSVEFVRSYSCVQYHISTSYEAAIVLQRQFSLLFIEFHVPVYSPQNLNKDYALPLWALIQRFNLYFPKVRKVRFVST